MSQKIELNNQYLKQLSPAGEILALHKGKSVFSKTWGEKYRYYDLASLTKILFTNELVILATKESLLKPKDFIKDHIPYWHPKVRLENLLRHDSGYSWWKAFYKMIPDSLERDLRYSYLKKIIYKEKRKKVNKAIYSDIDYFILGFVLERVFSSPLEVLVEEIDSPFHFNVDNKITKARIENYAPTEKCPFRKKRIQGEVHDLNAWSLGGVAPHAGLFGGMKEMKDWALSFRKNVQFDKVWQKYTKRAIPPSKGDWALGFMMPTKGSASCGDYFSSKSIGHTGFTGTSFWYDPAEDLCVILLANRVYYGFHHKKLPQQRANIHNKIYEAII